MIDTIESLTGTERLADADKALAIQPANAEYPVIWLFPTFADGFASYALRDSSQLTPTKHSKTVLYRGKTGTFDAIQNAMYSGELRVISSAAREGGRWITRSPLWLKDLGIGSTSSDSDVLLTDDNGMTTARLTHFTVRLPDGRKMSARAKVESGQLTVSAAAADTSTDALITWVYSPSVNGRLLFAD